MRISITKDTSTEDEELSTITFLPLVEKPASYAYYTADGMFAGNPGVAAYISLYDTDLCIHTNDEYTLNIDTWSGYLPVAHKRIKSARMWQRDGKTWLYLSFSAVFIDGVNRQLTVYVKPGYTAKVDNSKALVNLYTA